MIVAVLCGSAAEVRADLRALDVARARLPADVMAEVRLDLGDPPDLAIFRDAPVPLIATCRRPRDGGRFRGGEDDRLALLAAAAQAGARYVDVEIDALDRFGAGGAGIIASLHDFEATPADLPALVSRLLLPNVAFVKLATRARTLLDLMTLAAAVRHAPGRVFAVGLGGRGAAGRILADRLGSAWVNVTFASDGRSAPPEIARAGVPTLAEFIDEFRGGRLDRASPAFAVVGDRADESIGPVVFNRVLRRLGLPGAYVHMKTPSLAGLREACKVLNVRGLSVTTPFKETVLAAADAIDPVAAAAGAANTLVAEDGGWTAANTDVAGIATPLLARAAARGGTLAGADALVVGAGGLGRAAVVALRDAGCRVSLASRGADRLARAAEALGVPRLAAGDVPPRRFDVVVNATPAGSTRDPAGRAVDLSWVAPGGVVVETTYSPVETPLVALARGRGVDAITGDAVYAAQAAAQFARFLGGAPVGAAAAIVEATSWALRSNASS